MLDVVVPAKNIKLAKRSLDVSLYYCQERHDFESSTGRTQRLLLPICSAIHCRMSRISAFFKETMLQATLDVRCIDFNNDVFYITTLEFRFALWHRLD